METKTYTIEQFREYLSTQNSLGNAVYNLNRINAILKVLKIEKITITNEDEFYDYLADFESDQQISHCND